MKNTLKRLLVFFGLCCYLCTFSQVSEDFSDGDFSNNPSWNGTIENFIITQKNELQLNASTAAVSFLTTPSKAIKNACWEASFAINYNPSSANYACFYLTAESELLLETKGYFVQIGNTPDEVSLYRQDGSSKEKIIDGIDGRVNRNPVHIRVKVSCDSLGNWALYSKRDDETGFVTEGFVQDNTYKTSHYAGVLFKNSASTGKAYLVDSIFINGEEYPEPPYIPVVRYDKPKKGDLLINEVLFNNTDNSNEYVEIFNTTAVALDVSGLRVTTQMSDGTLNTGGLIPQGTILSAQGYLALSKNPSMDSIHYNCPAYSKFTSMTSWATLNNEGATIVLCNNTNDTLFDIMTYSPNWHHPLIQNSKGVALEKINPQLNSNEAEHWHSASSEQNYGTPGYQNSQFIYLTSIQKKSEFWLEKAVFSPNNDGYDDLVQLNYRFNETAWMANITIFDASGKIIKRFNKNELLSTEGLLFWNGKTDNNRLADAGIYIIYIETTNTMLSKTNRYKLICVLSA